MKTTVLVLAAILALGQITSPAGASSHRHTKHKRAKNTITQLTKARKTDHTVRQVTPDPHKSIGKHADNLSKNVNHEANRASKDVNHYFQGKK